MRTFYIPFFALTVVLAPQVLASCEDLKPEKGAAKACFDELNKAWETVKENDSSPLYQPLSRALKSMNAAAVSCDGPRTVNCKRMTDNAKGQYEAYKGAGGAAIGGEAAAGGGADNSVEYGKATKLLGLLSNKLANYSGADKNQIKSELDALTDRVNKACANQSSDACTAVLSDKTPFRAVLDKLNAPGGAPAAAPAAGGKGTSTVKSLGVKRPTRNK